MAFTIYGSLVPFNYHARSWDDAVSAFRWVLQTRMKIESRSDYLANCLLGVPLGYFLLGMLRVDRPGVLPSVFWASVLLPICTVFSACVEFSQLYFPGRTCSGSDIAAQAVGSAIGIIAWLVFGQSVTNSVRKIWGDPRAGGAVGRVLLAYVVVIALVQLLPLDIATSPKEIYRRLRDGAQEGRMTLIPFQEWSAVDNTAAPSHWRLGQTWLELIGLYLPAGLLIATLPGRFWRSWFSAPVVLAIGILLGAVLESAQVLVSRHPSTTDIIFGAIGVGLGWFAGRIASQNASSRGLRLELALVFAQIWFAVLAYTHWQSFGFGHARWDVIVWVPFADLQSKNYIGALDDVLERILMFAPIGVLVSVVGRPTTGWFRPLLAAATGFAVAFVLEMGQLFLPERYPTMTDLFTGTLGAFVSAVVVQKLRTHDEELI